MDPSLLATKLHVPAIRPESVRRPRLTRRLDESLECRLTLVSAPAGFGKTTLLSEWAASCGRPVAWVSLDEGDNDPVRFMTYLIAALQTIEVRQETTGNIGQSALSLLQSPQLPIESILTSLINDIAAIPGDLGTRLRIPRRERSSEHSRRTAPGLILVLDDYHLIEAEPIDKALCFLLAHLPTQLHLVIASRTDPSLPLSRLRAGGQMAEIRVVDLRFTPDEIATFLNTAKGLNLSPENMAALATRTEGWITGLQLAALSMQGMDAARAARFVSSFAGDNRYVVDYLVDEVLAQRPRGTKDFLLKTSILERMTGPLCDAVRFDPTNLPDRSAGTASSEGTPVTDQEPGQDLLESLEQANLFVVPLDDRRQWYRYHHLFADLLGHRLRRTAGTSDLLPALHRRASVWFAQNNLVPEAIEHSLAAGDADQAAQLVFQAWDDMCSRGEYHSTMLGWLTALPDEVVRARPHLGTLYAWLLCITLQLDAAEARLQEIERPAEGQLPGDLRLQIAVIRAQVALNRNDLSTALELSYRVLGSLTKNPSGDDVQAHIGLAFCLASCHLLEADVVKARHWSAEALRLSQEAGSITLTLEAMAEVAQVQIVQGQLQEAAETYRGGLQLAAEFSQHNGQRVPAAACLHVGLGDLLRERNKPDEAAHHLAQGIEFSRQCQIGEVLCNGYLAQARLRQAQGDAAGAQDLFRQAEQLAQAYQAVARFGSRVAACRAQLALARARSVSSASGLAHPQTAEQWAEARRPGADGSSSLLDEECEHLIWVRLLMAQNQPDQAAHQLARLLRPAEQGGRTGRVIEMLILQALAQQALGQAEQALIALEAALALAEPEGYVRLFVDEGRPMERLLREAARRGIARGYARSLLAASGAATKDDADSTDRIRGIRRRTTESPALSSMLSSPQGSLVEPLSERELEVLRLIGTGLSNREIAQELIIAVGTVKAHTSAIYRKLDARGRAQAVIRAGELDLF